MSAGPEPKVGKEKPLGKALGKKKQMVCEPFIKQKIINQTQAENSRDFFVAPHILFFSKLL